MSLPPITPAGKTLRFAVFEVDLAAGELRKNGNRIRLQEQPFQILVCLLDRAGEVITREDLRQKLWPADTFVDFDHSLNTAIAKLREALGDSASNPRYVETLARRGYRFLAPVQRAEAETAGFSAGNSSQLASAENSEASFHRDLEVPLPRRSLTRGLFGLIQLMYLIFYVSAPVPTERDRQDHQHISAGMGIAHHLRRGDGDGGRGYPVTLLPDLCRRLSITGRSATNFSGCFPSFWRWTSCGRWPRFSLLKRSALERPLQPRPRCCTCRSRRERWCDWRTRCQRPDNIPAHESRGSPSENGGENRISEFRFQISDRRAFRR